MFLVGRYRKADAARESQQNSSPSPTLRSATATLSKSSDAPQHWDGLDGFAEVGRSNGGLSIRGQVVRLVQKVQTLEAEQLLLRWAKEAKDCSGSTSRECAWSPFNRSSVNARLGQILNVVTVLRESCRVDGAGNEQAQKHRTGSAGC